MIFINRYLHYGSNLQTMALTSVFVCFYPAFDVSIGTLSERISRLSGCRVSRVDHVQGSTGRYCFVHFDQQMPEILWDMLSAGQETINTVQGPIRIGVNRSNGLDPNTKDEVTQFMDTANGLYWRDFKSGVVRKWNDARMNWFDAAENPFVSEIAVVEMEDDFTPAPIVPIPMDQEMDLSPAYPDAPQAPIKKNKNRRTTTDEEMGLRRTLFV